MDENISSQKHNKTAQQALCCGIGVNALFLKLKFKKTVGSCQRAFEASKLSRAHNNTKIRIKIVVNDSKNKLQQLHRSITFIFGRTGSNKRHEIVNREEALVTHILQRSMCCVIVVCYGRQHVVVVKKKVCFFCM